MSDTKVTRFIPSHLEGAAPDTIARLVKMDDEAFAMHVAGFTNDHGELQSNSTLTKILVDALMADEKFKALVLTAAKERCEAMRIQQEAFFRR